MLLPARAAAINGDYLRFAIKKQRLKCQWLPWLTQKRTLHRERSLIVFASTLFVVYLYIRLQYIYIYIYVIKRNSPGANFSTWRESAHASGEAVFFSFFYFCNYSIRVDLGSCVVEACTWLRNNVPRRNLVSLIPLLYRQFRPTLSFFLICFLLVFDGIAATQLYDTWKKIAQSTV